MIVRFFKGSFDILGRVQLPLNFLLNMETRRTTLDFEDALNYYTLRIPKGGRIEISAD